MLPEPTLGAAFRLISSSNVFFGSAGLPLACTRWVRLTLSSLCWSLTNLSSSMDNFSWKNFGSARNRTRRSCVWKHERYHCALPPPNLCLNTNTVQPHSPHTHYSHLLSTHTLRPHSPHTQSLQLILHTNTWMVEFQWVVTCRGSCEKNYFSWVRSQLSTF